MVSWLGDYDYEFPEPQKLEILLPDILEENVLKRYYLNKEQMAKVQWECKLYRAKKDRSKYFPRTLGGVSKKTNLSTMQFTQDDKIYEGNGVAYTHLTNHRFGTYLYAFEQDGERVVRALTPREVWRLFGFDDKIFSRVSKFATEKEIYALLGNSVVVNVWMSIFKQML